MKTHLSSKILPLLILSGCFLSLPATGRAAGGHSAPAGVAPGQAMETLLDGNIRFATGMSRHPRQDQGRRKELEQGQKPHAIVLSCSDSRVPPELIFDQGLGELFVVRVAGNVLGTSTVASMEYAVEHLGARLILIMGHESCGAVKAAIHTPPHQSTGSLDLDGLLSAIHPHLEGIQRSIASEDPKFRKPAKSNVDGVMKDLLRRSRLIRKAVGRGDVAIIKGLYVLDSGKVEFWGHESLLKTPSAPAHAPAAANH